jgi:hypothetical protein
VSIASRKHAVLYHRRQNSFKSIISSCIESYGIPLGFYCPETSHGEFLDEYMPLSHKINNYIYLINGCVAGFESGTVPCSENEMFESTEDQVFAIASDLTK